MAFTLSVLVGLPVVIGKITLATDFIRASRDVYFLSVQAVILLSRLSLMVAGWFLREVLMFPRLVIKTLASYIMETAGFDRLENPVEYVGNAINLSSDYLHKAYPQVPLESFQHVGRVPGVSTATGKILDGLELLGRTAHELYKAYRLKAIAIAGSPDSSDQLLCMVVGYASLSLSILCVAIADAADLLKLSPSLMDKSRSIQRFLKVCRSLDTLADSQVVFFMSLEIVCFPVFVGVAMDASTLPLFGATVEDRLLRLSHRPFGTVFVLWASGTIFMITFATFLTHMKKKVRMALEGADVAGLPTRRCVLYPRPL